MRPALANFLVSIDAVISCDLSHYTEFSCGKEVAIKRVSSIEVARQKAKMIIGVLRGWGAKSEPIATTKPQQHERCAQQYHAEIIQSDDGAQGADAEGDNRKYAVESFCQDHAHAPTWGMILGQAPIPCISHAIRPAGALSGGPEGRICQHGWLVSHDWNIPETASKGQRMSGFGRTAADLSRGIRIDRPQGAMTAVSARRERVLTETGVVDEGLGAKLKVPTIRAIKGIEAAERGDAATGGSEGCGACGRSQTMVEPARERRRSRSNKETRSLIGLTLGRNHLIKVNAKFVSIFLVSFWCGSASAQDQSPKQNAQDAAGVATDLMESTIKDTVNIEDIVPGFETADPDELTNHYEEKGVGLETATQEALQDLDNRGGEAGALIVDTYATRPEQSVTRTDGFLATARGVLQTPEALTDGMFSVNQAPNCEPTEVNAVAPGVRSCDIYSNVDELKCAIGQIVEVDAEKSYRCERETATYLKTCPETLQVQCLEPVSNCRLEDGLLWTAFPDLTVSYINGLHRLSIYEIDGFHGGPTDITRRARLNITDLSKVTSFRLSNVHYRTFLNLRLNGAPIYSGPGGDGFSPFVLGEFEYQIGEADFIYGIGQNGVYLTKGVGLPPVTETVGMDLIDHLVEGENIIEFDLIVSGTQNGRAEIEFTILLSCCANWQAEWVRQCP